MFYKLTNKLRQRTNQEVNQNTPFAYVIIIFVFLKMYKSVLNIEFFYRSKKIRYYNHNSINNVSESYLFIQFKGQ